MVQDLCLVPFSSFLMLNNIVTLKYGLKVIETGAIQYLQWPTNRKSHIWSIERRHFQ